MVEDYTNARTLGTSTRFGETFRLVRKRVNGKPWRKYLVVLHEGEPVTNCNEETDPAKALQQFNERFDRVFKTESEFRRVREEIRGKFNA